jgi:hypothetical protein
MVELYASTYPAYLGAGIPYSTETPNGADPPFIDISPCTNMSILRILGIARAGGPAIPRPWSPPPACPMVLGEAIRSSASADQTRRRLRTGL